jgi:hypothetical protein
MGWLRSIAQRDQRNMTALTLNAKSDAPGDPAALREAVGSEIPGTIERGLMRVGCRAGGIDELIG